MWLDCVADRGGFIMRLKFKVIFLLFIICILTFGTGCTTNNNIVKQDFNLKGENDNWITEYKGQSKGEFYKEKGVLKYKEKSDGMLTLTYKGNLSDLASVREIGYEFVNCSVKMTSDHAPDKKTFTWNQGLSAVVDENSIKNVDVIIDGKKEIIEMKSIGAIVDEKLSSLCDITDPSVASSSNPYDYIKHNEKDFEDIVDLGDDGLKYMLDKFKSSKENGLREYVMAIACSKILKENSENKNWSTGREWYNNYIQLNK